MALTVREQKAGSPGGYSISAPTYPDHPLRLKSQASRSSPSVTRMTRSTLKTSNRQVGQLRGPSGTVDPYLGSRTRTIV